MADFRELIRQESCDSEEYARREAVKKIAEEEKPFRERAEWLIREIKEDILYHARRGEYKLLDDKRYISREFTICTEYNDFGSSDYIVDFTRNTEVCKKYIGNHEMQSCKYFDVGVLKPERLFTPAKKHIRFTKGEKISQEIIRKDLETDGIKFAAYFVEKRAVSNSWWNGWYNIITGNVIYPDGFAFTEEPRRWFCMVYRYEFGY